MQRTDLTNDALIAIGNVVLKFNELPEGYCKVREIALHRDGGEIMFIPELSQRCCLATVTDNSLQLFCDFGYSTILLASEEIPFSKISLSPIQL